MRSSPQAIQGVVCQTLARTTDGKGRVVACEVMVATPAIRNLIREGKTHQIYCAMQAGLEVRHADDGPAPRRPGEQGPHHL